jgi:hypothetical protein
MESKFVNSRLRKLASFAVKPLEKQKGIVGLSKYSGVRWVQNYHAPERPPMTYIREKNDFYQDRNRASFLKSAKHSRTHHVAGNLFTIFDKKPSQ